MNINIFRVYSDTQNLDKTLALLLRLYANEYRCCVIILYYVNVICQIDILTCRSRLSVSLKIKNVSKHNTKEYSQGQP